MRGIGSGTNGTRRAGPDGGSGIRSDVARARNWRWSDVRRVGVTAVGGLLCCTLVVYIATSTSAKAHDAGEGPRTIAGCKQRYPKHDTDQAACILRVETEKSKCKVILSPCIGTIQAVYAMDGLGGGDTKLIWATRPTKASIQKVPTGDLEKQAFVCHTAPSVKIVAVFINRSHGNAKTLQRVPFGSHSCRVTLVWLRQDTSRSFTDPPNLLLEGTRIR